MFKKSVVNKTLSWDDMSDIKLSPPILAGLKSLNFKGPKPVQASTIPLFLQHKDVCVEAVTGSGKTLAFVIPILEMFCSSKNSNLANKHAIKAIILSPTQELAQQIYGVITEHFTLPHMPEVVCQLFIGGTRSPESDLKRFSTEGGQLIVATPGRLEYLLDVTSRTVGDGIKVTSLSRCASSCEVLVLDEADRLLDMGFSASLASIMGHLPKQRRTCLFSATLNEKVDCLIKAGLRNPISVVVKETRSTARGQQGTTQTARTPASLSCFYITCRPEAKFSLLVDHLTTNPSLVASSKIMVFLSSLSGAQYFAKAFKIYLGTRPEPRPTEVLIIHRKMRSSDRMAVLARFRESKIGPGETKRVVLFCTDVVARGIDVPDVDWVVHLDAPSSLERFLHRSGRTARSERPGNALLVLLPHEEPFVEFLALNRGLVVSPSPTRVGEYYFSVYIEKGQDAKAIKPNEELPILDVMRQTALRDRAYMLKGIKAFVSYVRSYTQHECRLIFRLKDLDLGSTATGYGLLYLPKMPEISRQIRRQLTKTPDQQLTAGEPSPARAPATLPGFEPPFPDTDVRNIPYSDPDLEKQRLARNEAAKLRKPTKRVSEIKEQKRRATVTKIRNKTDRDSHKLTRRERSKIKQTLDARDIAEIVKDAKLLKKYKNKKITESAFDKAFYAGL